jgi:signal transduction histidine kinase/CheY-like chemotaxis protein
VTNPGFERFERRVLILAPLGKDAALLAELLRGDGIECMICADLPVLLYEMSKGAAALVVAEEALVDGDARLPALLAKQPAWSDIPILLLTRPGADSSFVERATSYLGNVTLVERPTRVVAFSSAVRSALRARARQYQTRAYLQEREEADRRKDEFLATLAHELRNPLAPIRNWVNVLRMSGTDERGKHIWDMMDRQVSHMVRLVDDLMELSRITRGKIDLRIEPVALAPVIAAAVEASRPLMESARHQFVVDMPDETIVVPADAVRLAQIVSNLLNNAAKYTDEGGRITLSVKREGQWATISVRDTGVGISADALPRVFDMFVQEEVGDRRPQVGLGIGLTLVKSLVEMHRGHVDARSEGPGRGSEFVVRLPVSSGAPMPAEQDVLPLRRPRRMTRVLVVDDNEDAAESLGALLRMMGADVRVATDGWTALELFDAFNPAAVFLDLGMPDMDGYEVAHQIRSRPNAKDTVLIALTGWSQDRDRRRTAEAGFNRHLAKPADLETLQSVLASIAS